MEPVTIEAKLKPTGQGKVIINGLDISNISSGISIVNSVHNGNMVTITIPAPLIDLKLESDAIYFWIGERTFKLLDIEEV
jgi:hypothetical protein